MATLKFLTEPDQHPTDDVRDLIERLRTVFPLRPTDNVWDCWRASGRTASPCVCNKHAGWRPTVGGRTVRA